MKPSEEIVNGRIWPDGLRQFETILSLSEFSKGLRDIGIGTMLILTAAFNLLALPRILPNLNGLSTVSIIIVVVGIWKLFSGKQTCWNCSLEIRQRWLLSWSLFLDFALIAIRLLKKFWNPSWLAFVGSLCGLMSILFLVRFIYHLANIIDSKWGRTLSYLTQFTIISAMILVYAAAGMGLLQIAQPPVRISILFFGLALGGLSLCFFLALCFQMSYSIKGFVDFLYLASEEEDQDLNEELDKEEYRNETDREKGVRSQIGSLGN